jgi:peptidyl-prolyl cis-trans isomerase D
MTISDDDIVAYYQDNIADFITPEKRNISQMVFDNEEIANNALERVKKGEDFYRVAKEVANQDKETTFLGELTADSMLPELSEKVFDAKSGEITDVIKTEFGWHILKVNNIIPKIETPLEKVKNKIISIIKDERSYDEAQNIISDIEDEIAQGSNLADIANKYDVKLYNIKKLKDDGSYVSSSAKKLKEILNSSDLIDTVFSYNENEVSQAIETEDGFIFAAVNKINDAHIKDLSVVRPEIIKIWTENEKSAIAQEIINDVLLNLDNGDSLSEIASRFNLKLKTTNPLKRGEEFGILNSIHTTEAYQIPDGDHKLFTISGNAMIVSPIKTINSSTEVTNKQLNDINKQMSKELEQNLSEELINSYAKDMDVRVKYRLLGLEN